MRINILQGFENNSASLIINTDSPLIEYLDIVSKDVDEIYSIMYDIIKNISKQFFIIHLS